MDKVWLVTGSASGLSLHGAGSIGNWHRHYFPLIDYKDKYRLVAATPTSSIVLNSNPLVRQKYIHAEPLTFRENSPFTSWPSFCVCFGLFDCRALGIRPPLSRTSLAATADCIQEEAQTACANTMGSAVLGRPVPGLEPLASRACFLSARHSGALATGTISQIPGSAIGAQRQSSRKTCRCRRNPQTDPAEMKPDGLLANDRPAVAIVQARYLPASLL